MGLAVGNCSGGLGVQGLYFVQDGEAFIIIAIVVDDLVFASNSQPFLNLIKSKLSATFDIKLFGKLKTFIG